MICHLHSSFVTAVAADPGLPSATAGAATLSFRMHLFVWPRAACGPHPL
tara:strand:- start:1468 stop:1614 length:147 start_codon:yes stop_codon:yes gene_type:complete